MTLSIEQVSEGIARAKEKLAESEASLSGERDRLNMAIAKLEDYLWEHGEHTADSITEEFVALRDARAALKKQYENEDNALKEQMARRDVWLLTAINAMGCESIRTSHGTAYKQTKTRSSCGDWPAYWNYMKEHDRFDLVEKRVSQGAISKMIEDEEELPPGVNLFSEDVVTVRRA